MDIPQTHDTVTPVLRSPRERLLHDLKIEIAIMEQEGSLYPNTIRVLQETIEYLQKNA